MSYWNKKWNSNSIGTMLMTDDASSKESASKKEAQRLSIVNWIPSEIARQPEKLKGYVDALAADIFKHSISFFRFGDFVSVMQDRNGVKTMKAIQLVREYNKDEKGSATTLKPASITFDTGKPPTLDNCGWAGEHNRWSKDGDVTTFYSSPDFRGRYEYTNSMQGMNYYNQQEIKVRIATGLASPSVDDRLMFDGAGVHIDVPFGLGEETYKNLLVSLK